MSDRGSLARTTLVLKEGIPLRRDRLRPLRLRKLDSWTHQGRANQITKNFDIIGTRLLALEAENRELRERVEALERNVAMDPLDDDVTPS